MDTLPFGLWWSADSSEEKTLRDASPVIVLPELKKILMPSKIITDFVFHKNIAQKTYYNIQTFPG